MSGAKLFQHVDSHSSSHDVITGDGKVFEVTSCHHQMVNLERMDKEDYVLLAVTSKNEMIHNRSKRHIDADEEGLPRENKPLYEVEMAYFPKTNCLGFQGHPEFRFDVSGFSIECNYLIQKYLLKNDKISRPS